MVKRSKLGWFFQLMLFRSRCLKRKHTQNLTLQALRFAFPRSLNVFVFVFMLKLTQQLMEECLVCLRCKGGGVCRYIVMSLVC